MVLIRRRTRRSTVVALAFSLLAMAGCGESHEAIAPQEAPVVEATPAVVEEAAPPAVTAASTTTAHDEADSSSETSSEDAPLTPTPAESEEAKPMVAEYTPPFPDRVELFMPPKRQGGVRIEGDSEDAVELLGFIRLDRQQVVLSINGQITPIEEGASQHGVEVISIQPPKVVLQRGRQRWQASLEN